MKIAKGFRPIHMRGGVMARNTLLYFSNIEGNTSQASVMTTRDSMEIPEVRKV